METTTTKKRRRSLAEKQTNEKKISRNFQVAEIIVIFQRDVSNFCFSMNDLPSPKPVFDILLVVEGRPHELFDSQT